MWTRSREYDFRNHLKRKHRLEEDKINEILGGPPRRRRRKDRVIESDRPTHFSPQAPSIERNRQSPAEPQQRPLSPPVMPSVAYNPQLGDAEPEVTAAEHEDSPSELEHYAATHAPRILSEEDFALLGGYHKIHGWFPFVPAFLYAIYMIDSALRFPSAHPQGFTTADIPPNPGTLQMPTLPSPVGGYHTSPVSGDPPSTPWADATSTLTDASYWLGPVGDFESYYQIALPD